MKAEGPRPADLIAEQEPQHGHRPVVRSATLRTLIGKQSGGQDLTQVLEIVDVGILNDDGPIVVSVGEVVAEDSEVRQRRQQQENSEWPPSGKKSSDAQETGWRTIQFTQYRE